MIQLVAHGVRSFVRSGPAYAVQGLRHKVSETLHERRLGIRTALNDAECGSPTEYQPYVAAPYACLATGLRATGVNPGRDVFLDYGSGKGRVISFAATRPFARVIGVEMRPELNEAARANVGALRGRRCEEVEIVTGDATQYAVPDDVTVVFLFNPFTRNVLRATCDRLCESLARRPRPMRVVYMNPREDDCELSRCDGLKRVRELSPGRWHNMRFGLFHSR